MHSPVPAVRSAGSGLFDEHTMWQRITAGLRRGSAELRWNHVKLSDVGDNLGETRQYMRVHWSGVLYWLKADIELRRQPKGTLDAALKQLKDCCEAQSMSAAAIARKLDQIVEREIFTPLFLEYRASYRLPEYEPLLAELGIRQNDPTGGVSLANDAPLADIRRELSRR